jgi:glycosyltransferase involved in cell wall biosynthesis
MIPLPVESSVARGKRPTPRSPNALCLSVVIPVYNERHTLAEIIRRVRAVPIAKEIILIDDGSTDGTRDLLRSLDGDPDLRILYHQENRGKGAALKTGFLQATGDIVIVQDADLEYDPADYRRLIQPILQNKADVVYGSRFLSKHDRRGPKTRTDNPGSLVLSPFLERALSFWHSLGNRVLTTLSNVFTNLRLTDMETCYKVFRREVVQGIVPRLQQSRFGIEAELTARVARGGYRIYEVGIGYEGRTRGQGKKIGWRDGLKALWCILRY